MPHYYRGELVGTHRVFDERLTVALLAMRQHLAPISPDRYAEQEQFAPEDFESLVERVASGEELWAEAAEGDDEGRKGGEE